MERKQLTEKERKLLETELETLHQEEEQNYNSGRNFPKYSSWEGFDKQELYDEYGHC